MASRIPDLLSDSPPPELLSESTHSDILPSSTSSGSKPVNVTSRPHPTSSPSHGRSKATPPAATPSPGSSPSSSGFLSYPTFSRMASSLTRRLTDPDAPFFGFGGAGSSATGSSMHQSQPEPAVAREKRPAPATSASATASLGSSAVFQPPNRTGSPFSPPPLTGLTLVGLPASSRPGAQLLNKALAEEIRLLLPPRLQLSEDWTLAFSVERDGVSLHTLYDKCVSMGGPRARGGWVLVVRDGGGSIFGAYLTDAPHPSSTYYGTGECFLWRASMVTASSGLMLQGMNLPPPPSEDTSGYSQRHVTIASPTSPQFKKNSSLETNGNHTAASGTSTPDLLRFKAFPYSGVNDYLIYCEPSYLSVGGGDGRYGLWLDSSLEKGVSSPCMTFGNEALSEDGQKFEILGVEVWFVAA